MAWGTANITVGRYWVPTVAKEYIASYSFGGAYSYFYNADEIYANGRGTAQKIGGGSTTAWDNLFLNDKNDVNACKKAISGFANSSYSIGKNINIEDFEQSIALDSGVCQYNFMNYVNKNNFSTFGYENATSEYEAMYGKRLEKFVQLDLIVAASYEDSTKVAILEKNNYSIAPAFPHLKASIGDAAFNVVSLSFGNGYMPGEV